MSDIKSFRAGDTIKDKNERVLFRFEEDTVYNGKFYIVRVIDTESGCRRLLKFAELEDGFRHANLTREGSFRFFFPYIEHVYGMFFGKTSDGTNVEGVSVEFIEGTSLDIYRERLELDLRQGSISEYEMDCTIFRQILQLLHAMKYYTQFADEMYLHRDLKPGNVMITDDGDVRLVDFDYAHISGSTRTVNTKEQFWNMGFSAGYTSPEVFEKGKLSTLKTELYSAGRTLFFWLNARHYYTDEQTRRSASSEWGRYITDEGLKYGFDTNIDRFSSRFLENKYQRLIDILNKMCASPDEERYLSVNEVIEDMERFLLGFCGNSVSRYDELFGVEKLHILHVPLPEFRTQKHVMTAYRINGGPMTGKPLYEYSVRDIEADGRKILMIYNIGGIVCCVPVQGDYTFINGDPAAKHNYILHDKDKVSFGRYCIDFTINERNS